MIDINNILKTHAPTELNNDRDPITMTKAMKHMRRLGGQWVLVFLVLFSPSIEVDAGSRTVKSISLTNGDFDLPGDTWKQGGGVPDGWEIENHTIELGTGGAEQSPGTVGLNHRWHGLVGKSARSLYLMDPQGAIVRQEADGKMLSGVTYQLRFGYFRYRHEQATITATLKVGDAVVAAQSFAGESFPYRQWQVRELSHTAGAQDEGLPVSVSFEISGQGDVRLDGVEILNITPEIAAFNETLKAYREKVEQLEVKSLRGKQKKAILLLALERAENASEAHLESESQILLEETDAAMHQTIETRPAPRLSQTLLPDLKTLDGNPYLESLYAWAHERLSMPDIPFKKATPEFNPLPWLHHDYGTREEAANMNRYFWLVAHPQSRYYGNPELLARLFRRINAYVDAYRLHGRNYKDYTNDFFAIGPVVEAMLKTRRSFQDLLLPSDAVRWDAMIEQVNGFWFNEYEQSQEGAYRMGRYTNRDIAVANILLACGLYLDDAESLAAARTLIVAQRDNLFPDGGFSYIGTQNESCGYHGANTRLLTRYYHLSGEPLALQLLKKSQWYGPLSIEPGNVSEFWTSPSWKHGWNTEVGLSVEAVATLTGNRYLRTLHDRMIAKRGAAADPLEAMWYQGDIKAAQLPDNYAIFDRNIQGPRGRFGRFSYAANLRVPDNGEPGINTVMGAMTIEQDLDHYAYPLEAILSNIMPRVFLETTPGDHYKRPSWAWLTCRDQSAVSMGQDWSALWTSYQMHTYGSSRKGIEVPWEGEQIWLNVGDRLFGLLEIAPQGEQDAFEVAIVATLGAGGTGETRPKDLKMLAPQHWSLGSLNMAILDHNFASVRVVETKIRNSSASQIVCSTQSLDEPISDPMVTHRARATAPLRTFTPENRHYAVVEVSASETEPKAVVERIAKGGLRGLSVRLADASYTLLLNHQDQPIRVDLSRFSSSANDVWVHYRRSEGLAPHPLKERNVLIPAGQHRVFLSGVPSESARLKGWENFEAMIREKSGEASGLSPSVGSKR